MYYDRKTLDEKYQKMSTEQQSIAEFKSTFNTDIVTKKIILDSEMDQTEIKIQHAFNFTFIGLLMMVIGNAFEIPNYSLITTGISLAALIIIVSSLIAIRRLITRMVCLSDSLACLFEMAMREDSTIIFKPICGACKTKESQEKAAE